MFRLCIEAGGGAIERHAALRQTNDPISQRPRQRDLMQYQNDGQAVAHDKPAEFRPELPRQHRIDRGKRLIAKKQARAPDQSAGDADALALAACTLASGVVRTCLNISANGVYAAFACAAMRASFSCRNAPQSAAPIAPA